MSSAESPRMERNPLALSFDTVLRLGDESTGTRAVLFFGSSGTTSTIGFLFFFLIGSSTGATGLALAFFLSVDTVNSIAGPALGFTVTLISFLTPPLGW